MDPETGSYSCQNRSTMKIVFAVLIVLLILVILVVIKKYREFRQAPGDYYEAAKVYATPLIYRSPPKDPVNQKEEAIKFPNEFPKG